MNPQAILSGAQEAMHVRRVFADPVQFGEITVIPAAIVNGGGGGGGGSADEGGGGFGVRAKPAGAFVIRNGDVCWRPAVNVNQIVAGAQLVAIAALFALRPLLSRWRSRS
jgi:hypothetical protein